jgi:lipoprotein signal peptidase
LHRRASAWWFGASFLLAASASLGTGELIREHLRTEQSFWLISRTVYLVRDQHLRAPFPLLSPTLTLVLWSIFAIVVVILIHSLRLGTPGLSALPEIVAGLCMGGGLANVLEAQMIGSVTDFLGIHGFGTYSAGDIAWDVGSSLLPIAVIHIAQTQKQTLSRVLQAGAGFYGAVVAFAVVSQDYALAILVTLVSGGGVAVSLIKRSGSPQIRAR